jgi:hypothetical protein
MTVVKFVRPDGTIEGKDISWCRDHDFHCVDEGVWSGDWYEKLMKKKKADSKDEEEAAEEDANRGGAGKGSKMDGKKSGKEPEVSVFQQLQAVEAVNALTKTAPGMTKEKGNISPCLSYEHYERQEELALLDREQLQMPDCSSSSDSDDSSSSPCTSSLGKKAKKELKKKAGQKLKGWRVLESKQEKKLRKAVARNDKLTASYRKQNQQIAKKKANKSKKGPPGGGGGGAAPLTKQQLKAVKKREFKLRKLQKKG